ncbi:MAG: putative hemolysin [Paracoccaceae bacterium]|jgi:putative hemolysin
MAPSLKSEEKHFELRLAQSSADLIAAQRLRYRVFVQELGATGATVDQATCRESDGFDGIYDHLILIDRRRDPRLLDHVVGVYRLLRGEIAKANDGFYSATEFDLSVLNNSGRNLLELGRSCVDANYRGGVAVYLLWNGLAEYVLRHRVDVLFGVASYHGTDVMQIAQSLSFLHQNHLAPTCLRVNVRPAFSQPMDIIAAPDLDRVQAMAQTPALIKAYLRLGGSIGDGAYIDHDFNTIDVCLMMDTARMSTRHKAAYTRRSDRALDMAHT